MASWESDKDAFYKEARWDIPGPLAGVRVLEVTTTLAGPRCGNLLADYGAEVIRVELASQPDISRLLPPFLPTDPPDSFLNATVNRNKKSIILDVRTAEGRDVLLRLITGFDIMVENFKRGTLDGYGCGYEAVRKVKPDIIFVSINGFGQYGPYADRPGYDPAAQAYSGFMWMNAPKADDPPMRAPIYLADELAGMHAAAASMAALHYRDKTGEGQRIDVSLLDATMDSCTGLHTIAAAGFPTPRVGNPIPFAAPTGIYHCKDGYVYAGVLLDSHWKIMANMIGKPELAEHPEYATFQMRVKNRPQVDAILEAWCMERTRAEVEAICQEHHLAVAVVYTPQEAIEDEHVKARGAVQPLEYPGGEKVNMVNTAAKFSRTPAFNRNSAPRLGAHTNEVLLEAGLDEKEIQALQEKGVI
jgi:formyl-CoA transferase